MARENKTYPIILNDDYKDPVGAVFIYRPDLHTATWELVPISGGRTDRNEPKQLLGFSMKAVPSIAKLEDDVMDKIYAKQAARMAERDALRKEILLEVIESITKL